MNPTISIIIPVYGTETYLKRCIESVLDQNYEQLEIIVVNDCSPGNAEEIVDLYRAKDQRIKYISHEHNRGLFQARMTGAGIATGEYIAFLDSDDYVAFDFYYTLVTKIQKENADIVIGKTVKEREDGSRYVLHFHECSLNFEKLEGEDVQRSFFGQQGRCFSWHTIWNKLYSKKLWDKCFPYYTKIHSHVIMTEDIAFSSVLFFFAKKVVTVNSSAYFYCENNAASTNSKNITIDKFQKNLKDITTVFDFVENFLQINGAGENVVHDFAAFRKYYARMWQALVQKEFVGKYKKEALGCIRLLAPDVENEGWEPEDSFFDSLNTEWHGGFEAAKERIRDPAVRYISFDIFDTLVTRPLYAPEQVFELLDYGFKRKAGTNASFVKIRMDAETYTRQKKGAADPTCQDVTIDEIYKTIMETYHLDKAVADESKRMETELEIALSKRRQSAGELFDLAKALGKKVIIVSDMYLNKDTIEALLRKNGYCDYSKLYLSSDLRLTKYTGDLFKYVLNDLGCKPDEILHLGDTWESDFVNPGRLGIQCFFFPKCREVFENIIQGQSTNRCASIGNWAAAGVIKQNSYRSSLGYGAMMSIVARKYFDNPYRTFHKESDFNADPYFIGYYPVGMHLYGLACWLVTESRKYGYKKLFFMSRDGYLPMLVYKKVAALWEDAPEAEYIYSSRKALMPFIIKGCLDIFDFPTVITNQSPETMRQMLEFCIDKVSFDDYKDVLKKHGIAAEKRFADRASYNKFVTVFLQEFYSESAHDKAKQLCREYYSRLDESSATVDMGYSGRIQGAVSAAAGHGVDVFFIHADANQYSKEQNTYDFQIHNFYEYTPCMTGVCREHILSSFEPSCIAFERKEAEVLPVFEQEEKDIQDRWVVTQIQRGALDFADDFIRSLGDYCTKIPIKPAEVSLPYEGFLRFASDTDIKIFSASFFEDEVWGGAKRINIAEFIKGQYEELNRTNHFPNAEVIVKQVVSDGWVMTIKRKLKRFPVLYKAARNIYTIVEKTD